MRRTGFAAIALAAALTMACSSKPENNTAATAGNEAPPVGTSGKNNVPAADRDLAREAAMTDMAEIELATVVKERASDPQTKKFAQMMIDDHTAADEKLKAFASQNGIELPTQIDDKHADLKEKLTAKQGLDVDKTYADAMVDGHQDFVNKLESRIDKKTLSDWKTFQTNQKNGKREETKTEAVAVAPENSDDAVTAGLNQWAAQTYPVAYAHLEAAKDLQAGLKKRSTN